MTFYLSPSSDPFYNIALEEYILTHTKANVLLCYINDPSIVLGRFQVPYKEVDAEVMSHKDINLARRLSGGGTVFHDTGNLNYSFIYNDEDIEGEAYDFFNAKTVAVLNDLGLSGLTFERNNIFCKEKKISGVAQYKRGKRMVHHGTLLVDADLTLLRQVFTKKDYYTSKGVASVSSSVANVAAFVSVTMPEVVAAFQQKSDEDYTIDIDDEWVAAKMTEYASAEWVHGRSPNYSLTKGGVTIDVKKGKIQLFAHSKYACLEGCFHQYNSLALILQDKIPGVKASSLF